MDEFEFPYGKELRPKRSKPIMYILGGRNGDCWECVSHALDRDGYPKINFRDSKWKMSRFSYVVYYKREIRDGMNILHSCDNPACINPLHLSEGTHADNVKDKVSKGRTAVVKGNDNGKSKLCEDQVREIKLLLKDGIKSPEICKSYDVGVDAIYAIKYGRSWAWLEV